MKKVAIALLVIVMMAGSAMAGPAMPGNALNQWANSSNYLEKVPGMIGRGAVNALVSPFDFVMGLVNECREKPSVYCPVTGLLRGTQDLLDRDGRALFDIGGSIFPKFNGFPNYKPCPLTGKSLGSGGGKATA